MCACVCLCVDMCVYFTCHIVFIFQTLTLEDKYLRGFGSGFLRVTRKNL